MAAAKLAENLRREAEIQGERQKSKMLLFTTLMQERAQIYSDNGVRALNLIDVVFNHSRDVREAWSELFLALQMNPFQQHVMEERLRRLLAAIARDIGLADALRTDDLGRIYYPRVMAEDQFIRNMQRQQMLTALQQQGQNPAQAGAGGLPTNIWPPKPE